jgi:hypothetical protein
MLTNYEKASKLYDHCSHYITHNQQLKFLDCLKSSGNYPALEILDPERPIEHKSTTTVLSTTPTELIRDCISTSNLARILHDKTDLGDKWTILKRVLEITPGKWAEISGKYPHLKSLFDTIESALQTWSASKGFKGATVGRLYDKFKEQDSESVGGKLNKILGIIITEYSELNQISIKSIYSISDILMSYPGVTRDTLVTGSVPNTSGFRMLNITV